MEWDVNSFSRKFEGSAVWATFNTKKGVREVSPVLLVNITSNSDGFCVGHAWSYNKRKSELVTFNTSTSPSEFYDNWPSVEPIYWNPKTGWYQLFDTNTRIFVERRITRSFRVGLNPHSHTTNGMPLDRIDIRVPPVEVYVEGGKFFVRNKVIGLVKPDCVFLPEPAYAKFLPPDLRELWKKS